MDNTHTETDREERSKETLGDILERSRTSQHKTLDEAAAVTRIHSSSLKALEENDFARLPAEVFVRGFIRLYARYLGLDPEETLSHYLAQKKAAHEQPFDKPYHREFMNGESLAEPTSFIRKNGKIIAVTILLTILVVFYVLGVFFKSTDPAGELQIANDKSETLVENFPQPESSESADQPETGKEVPEPPARQNEKAPPATDEKPAATKPPGTAGPTAEKQKQPAPPPESRPTSQTLPVTVKVATEPPVDDSTLSASDVDFKYVLEAQFRERSLVTIKVDDQPQRQYPSQAGVVRVWKANNSIFLELDNPTGVSLSLNGKPLPGSAENGKKSSFRIPEDTSTNQQP